MTLAAVLQDASNEPAIGTASPSTETGGSQLLQEAEGKVQHGGRCLPSNIW